MNTNRISPLVFAAGLAGGYLLARGARRRAQRMDFTQKTVVITGGSRGLGLEMARLLAKEGANLALLARNEPELAAATQELEGMGATVLPIRCDVGDRKQVEAAFHHIAGVFGGVDVLINNAGVMQVAPVEDTEIEDYEDAMRVHFWGPLYAMRAAIPLMRMQGGGRIVNIASIGAKVAVPHMAPYVASKFALEGLSDVYAAELARNNIQVTTINPGLMRTGSFYHANFKGRYQQEFAWFSALATNPLVAMSSARAAKQVIQALRYAVPEKTLTFQARILQLVEEISPNLTAWILKTTNQALPRPAGLPKQELKTGFESRTEKVPRSLTKLGDRAAQKNNELIAKY